MGAGKNKAHRRRRISKHVLRAEERGRKEREVSSTIPDDSATTTSSDLVFVNSRNDDAREEMNIAIAGVRNMNEKDGEGGKRKDETKTNKNDRKTKDPGVGASYLSLWKYDRRGSWKFNKNVQSWLYRHMYDRSRVSKASFAILIEYAIEGRGGDDTRRRLVEDAKRRARRYKDWEGGRRGCNDANEDGRDDGVVAVTSSGVEGGGGTSSSSSSFAEDAAWHAMDEHDKRREYKRARKVLDALVPART